MVAQRAVRKQQDTSRPQQNGSADHASRSAAEAGGTKAGRGSLALLRPVAETFNAAVAQCVQDADPESVHRLRTGSRRLQAMLEATLREDGVAGNALDQPARAWLRQLKQVRRAAGAVRDLDVQGKLLEKWIDKRVATPAGSNEADPGKDASRLQVQAELLDAWLKNERRHLAHGMQKQIGKRQPRLAERQTALFLAIVASPRINVESPRTADTVALEDFVRAADTMPLLDADNLHDFRKATKKARYVAEAGAEGQRLSSVAKALKRVQDAIGEWHDWLCLAEDARVAQGQDAPELTAALQHEVERYLAAAMKTTQIMRGRLSGEWIASRRSDAPEKRPSAGTAVAAAKRMAAAPAGRDLEAVKRQA
jgi:CHAD domain-containing protein